MGPKGNGTSSASHPSHTGLRLRRQDAAILDPAVIRQWILDGAKMK